MSSLADKVIEANDESLRQETNPIEVDDVGLPLPLPDTEKAWCEYLTARLLYLNNRMYKYCGCLWIHDAPIKENKATYYELAAYPKVITDPQCKYIWRRAKELVPELDTEKVAVLPGATFDMKTGKFDKEDIWTTSSWGKNNGGARGGEIRSKGI